MLTRTEFLFLISIALIGCLFCYAIPDLILWLRYSIIAVVMTVAFIVIFFGIFLFWCCAKLAEYNYKKDKQIFDESNSFYSNYE